MDRRQAIVGGVAAALAVALPRVSFGQSALYINPEWWGLYEPEDNLFPPFDITIHSPVRVSNIHAVNTVWGVWNDDGVKKIMMIYAWDKDLSKPQKPAKVVTGGTNKAQMAASQWAANKSKKWDIDTWISFTGIKYSTSHMVADTSRSADAAAMFRGGLVHAPDRAWADLAIYAMVTRELNPMSQSVLAALAHLESTGLVGAKET